MIVEIQTSKAPQPIGIYSQAISAGGFLFVSGQIPLLPSGELVSSPKFVDHAKQVFENLKMIAQAAGADLKQTVKITVYLREIANIQFVNTVMATYFSQPFPARVSIAVSQLPKGCDIEIDAIILL